jgi:hypothetical protein
MPAEGIHDDVHQPPRWMPADPILLTEGRPAAMGGQPFNDLEARPVMNRPIFRRQEFVYRNPQRRF